MDQAPNAQLDQERLIARIEALQCALEQMSVEIERLSDLASLGELAAMIAHEVRNLMTPVAGYASSALKRPDDSAYIARALNQAAENAMQAVGVSDAILDLATSAGAAIESPPPRPLSDLLDAAVESLADRRRAVELESHIERGLIADIDPRALQQTLMNLVLNAIDASAREHVRVEVSAARRPPCSTWNTGSIVMTVRDNGPGLSAGAGEDIFQPFVSKREARVGVAHDGLSHTGDTQPQTQRRGVGLGLALCKRLIERAGGVIEVESEPGAGACFRLTLPLAADASDDCQ